MRYVHSSKIRRRTETVLYQKPKSKTKEKRLEKAVGNGPIDRRFNYVFGKAGIHSLPGQAPEAIEGIVHAPLTNRAVGAD